MVMPLHEHPCPVAGCKNKVYSTMSLNAVRLCDWLYCDDHLPDMDTLVPFEIVRR